MNLKILIVVLVVANSPSALSSPANVPPELHPIGPQEVIEGDHLSFDISATDADGDSIVLSTSTLPPGALFIDHGDNTGNFDWTPDFTQAGLYFVTFRASDGVVPDTELVMITVFEVGNQPPVLAPIGPQYTAEGIHLRIEVLANDPDGTTPTLSTSPLPSGASFIDYGVDTGEFNWTPSYGQAGTHDVTFRAFDGALWDSELVTITVTGGDDRFWHALGSGVNGGVLALAEYQGDLIAGGQFTIAGGVGANYIARWNGSDWQSVGTGMDAPVYTLTVYDGDLIVGGDFTTAGGVSASHIARWNGSEWLPLGPGIDRTVASLTEYNGNLVAGGAFTTAGGVSAIRIAVWDGSSWQPLGSGVDSTVIALTVYEGDLIAAGSFTSAGGIDASHVARWNGTAWDSLGSGLDDWVRDLTIHDGELIAGGYFYTSSHVVRWDGLSWVPLGLSFQPFDRVHALASYRSDLIAGGEFGYAGDAPANFIARWNGSSWHTLGSGMDGSSLPFVWVLGVYDDELIAGGTFERAGGQVVNRITAWNKPTCPNVEMGDVSCDAVVDLTDVVALGNILDGLVAPTETCVECAGDVNGNGLIDQGDYEMLYDMVAGVGP
jgi:PKD repeat protein